MTGTLLIPDAAWQEDEEGRLNASVLLKGQLFHATALPIRDPEEHEGGDYIGTTEFVENYIFELEAAFGSSEPFEPTAILGKRYLVFLCPCSI